MAVLDSDTPYCVLINQVTLTNQKDISSFYLDEIFAQQEMENLFLLLRKKQSWLEITVLITFKYQEVKRKKLSKIPSKYKSFDKTVYNTHLHHGAYVRNE